jgi:hypothetical protein
MRVVVALICLATLAVAGCAGKKAAVPPPGMPAQAAATPGASQFEQNLLVTPDTGLAGKVARVNPEGRFVVLNFPVGHLPAMEQRLMVYRSGLKVGEVKVTGPRRDDNIVGDIVSGEALPGDVVRDK